MLTDKLELIKNQLQKNYLKIEKKLSEFQATDQEISQYVSQIKKCSFLLNENINLLSVSLNSSNIEKILPKIRHDLINPINGIRGYCEMILEKTSDFQAASHVKFILSHANIILDLIGELNLEEQV